MVFLAEYVSCWLCVLLILRRGNVERKQACSKSHSRHLVRSWDLIRERWRRLAMVGCNCLERKVLAGNGDL